MLSPLFLRAPAACGMLKTSVTPAPMLQTHGARAQPQPRDTFTGQSNCPCHAKSWSAGVDPATALALRPPVAARPDPLLADLRVLCKDPVLSRREPAHTDYIKSAQWVANRLEALGARPVGATMNAQPGVLDPTFWTSISPVLLPAGFVVHRSLRGPMPGITKVIPWP